MQIGDRLAAAAELRWRPSLGAKCRSGGALPPALGDSGSRRALLTTYDSVAACVREGTDFQRASNRAEHGARHLVQRSELRLQPVTIGDRAVVGKEGQDQGWNSIPARRRAWSCVLMTCNSGWPKHRTRTSGSSPGRFMTVLSSEVSASAEIPGETSAPPPSRPETRRPQNPEEGNRPTTLRIRRWAASVYAPGSSCSVATVTPGGDGASGTSCKFWLMKARVPSLTEGQRLVDALGRQW